MQSQEARMLCRLMALILFCILGMDAVERPPSVATTPARHDEPDAIARHEAILRLPGRATAPLVFLGDSITERWEAEDGGRVAWQRHWQPLGALDFGVSGDRTEHVLWRMAHGAFDGMAPKLVVLLIGTNNAGQQAEPGGYRCSPRQTADGILAIVDQLRSRCPASRILLLAILPRGEEETDPIRQQTDAANALVKTSVDGRMVRFLDVGHCFMKPENTDVNIALMPDLLHPSPEGYQRWAEALAPVVAEMLR
jgi:lysophospholipase L1-like esterase